MVHDATERLWELAISGDQDVDKYRALVAEGADLNAADSEGNTTAHYLARHCPSTAVMTWAIREGADPLAINKEKQPPLSLAVQHSANPDVVLTLLAAGANPDGRNDTPLITAVRRDKDVRLEMVRALLSAGASVWDRLGARALLLADDPAVIRELVDAGANYEIVVDDETALERAIKRNDVESVQVLLDAGAFPSATLDRKSPLVLAKTLGHKKIVAILEAAGAVEGIPK